MENYYGSNWKINNVIYNLIPVNISYNYVDFNLNNHKSFLIRADVFSKNSFLIREFILKSEYIIKQFEGKEGFSDIVYDCNKKEITFSFGNRSFDITYSEDSKTFNSYLHLNELKIPDQNNQKIPIVKSNQEMECIEDFSSVTAGTSYIAIYSCNDYDENLNLQGLRPMVVWRDPLTYEKKGIQLYGTLEEGQKMLVQLQSYLTEQHEKVQKERKNKIEPSSKFELKALQKSRQIPELPKSNCEGVYLNLVNLYEKLLGNENTDGCKNIELVVRMIKNQESITGLKDSEKQKWYQTIQSLLDNVIPIMEKAVKSDTNGEVNKEAKEKASIWLRELVEMGQHCAGRWINVVGDLYAAYKGGENLLTGNETPESFMMRLFDQMKSVIAKAMKGSEDHNVHVYNWVVKCLKSKDILLPDTLVLDYDDVFQNYGKDVYPDSEAVLHEFRNKMKPSFLAKHFISQLDELRLYNKSLELNCIIELRGMYQDEQYKKEIERLNSLSTGYEKDRLILEAQERALFRGGYLEEDFENKDQIVNVRLKISESGAILLMKKFGILS